MRTFKIIYIILLFPLLIILLSLPGAVAAEQLEFPKFEIGYDIYLGLVPVPSFKYWYAQEYGLAIDYWPTTNSSQYSSLEHFILGKFLWRSNPQKPFNYSGVWVFYNTQSSARDRIAAGGLLGYTLGDNRFSFTSELMAGVSNRGTFAFSPIFNFSYNF